MGQYLTLSFGNIYYADSFSWRAPEINTVPAASHKEGVKNGHGNRLSKGND